MENEQEKDWNTKNKEKNAERKTGKRSKKIFIHGDVIMEGYCVKCHKKVEIKDGQKVPCGNNGRFMFKGVCPDCGTVVCRFLKKEKKERKENG